MDASVKYFLILIACICFSLACQSKHVPEKVICDFETDAALDKIHWSCHTLFSLSDQHSSHGRKSLKFEMFPSAYPGFTPHLKINDWEKFQTFCFDVYNPEKKPVKLTLRIDDKKEANEYSDRYNKSFEILPGANQIEIPLETLKTSIANRKMNRETIYRFLVFMVSPEKKHVLYFDYFRLVSIHSDSS